MKDERSIFAKQASEQTSLLLNFDRNQIYFECQRARADSCAILQDRFDFSKSLIRMSFWRCYHMAFEFLLGNYFLARSSKPLKFELQPVLFEKGRHLKREFRAICSSFASNFYKKFWLRQTGWPRFYSIGPDFANFSHSICFAYLLLLLSQLN